MLRDKAQIPTARLHSGGFGLELMAGQVEVYLLAAELEGVAVFAERDGSIGGVSFNGRR